MNSVKLAWAGGLIDGEGCVYIKKTLPEKAKGAINPSYHVGLKISMCDEYTIRHIYDLFGVGHVRTYDPKGHNLKTTWHWNATNRQAEKVLKWTYPYVITKREQYQIAFELLDRIITGGNRLNEEEIKERERIFQEMKLAKKR